MQTAEYGSWVSPLKPEYLTQASKGYSTPRSYLDGLVWSEFRPNEGGRSVLVYRDKDGHDVDLVPEGFNVRSRVHEYGGGAWWLGGDSIFFSNFSDLRVYQIVDSQINPVTPDGSNLRFCDGDVSNDGQYFVCVAEDHSEITLETHGEPKNNIVLVSEGSIKILVDGPDFVARPRLSPDGKKLAWLEWDHPNMPWDETRLMVASFDNGQISQVVKIAGGDDQSVQGLGWASDGSLIYINDKTGFWNLYRWDFIQEIENQITNLSDSEIGEPLWVFSSDRWVELSDGRIVAAVSKDGSDSLSVFNSDGSSSSLECPIVAIDGISKSSDGMVFVSGSSTRLGSHIISVDVNSNSFDLVVGTPSEFQEYFSEPTSISVEHHGRSTHAFFYPPYSPDYQPLPGSLPPLIVTAHGGPTGHSKPGLNLKYQFWTSRGFGVVDVNYAGSTGFGRQYRELLKGNWGIYDVEDVIAVADYLAEISKVSSDSLLIRGGSAGGFTVLMALVTSDIFAAGTCLYGVSDLEALTKETHKFESRYLDTLIAPYPEQVEVYKERSPINHVDKLKTPMLVLQGDEDQVVPKYQSIAIVEALTALDIPNMYIEFEGEQHGFRKAETIIKSLEAELWFYSQILGFKLVDEIDTTGFNL